MLLLHALAAMSYPMSLVTLRALTALQQAVKPQPAGAGGEDRETEFLHRAEFGMV